MAGGGTGGHVSRLWPWRGSYALVGVRLRFIGTQARSGSEAGSGGKFSDRLIEIGGLKRVGLRRTLSTLVGGPGQVR